MAKSSIAGDASKKILRILFSLVFAAGLLPYVPVASAHADQLQGAQSQPDVLAEDNPEAVSSEKDASVDGSAASLDPSKQIEFVYVDQKDISVGDTQNVVVSFADSKNADGSTLYYQKQGGKIESIKASKSADGAALYEIPFKTASDCGKYNLVKVAWNGSSSGESKIASDTEDGYSFSVVDKVVDEDEDGVSAYSLDGNGEITKEDSVADAIVSATNETANSSSDDDAAVSEGAAGEVQSYASVAGVAPLAIGGDESRASKKMVIALDAGHGGSDSGAVNEGKGLYEKTLTLKIAQYCKAELDTYSNVSTYMTRSGDEYVGLSERVKRAVNAGANVFVSFHINSAESVATGFEVWVQNDSSWRYYLHEQSSQLGSNILSKLTALGLANRGNKESDSKSGNKYADGSPADYLTVLEQSRQNNIPAVLIEHGFINGKPADQNLLSSESGLKSMGVADAKAIAENYGLSKGGQSVSSSSSIMGQSSTAVGQMVAYYESTGHSYPSSVYANKGAASLRDFCQIAYEEAAAEGVRAEVLFCQAMKETGWLQFGGDVKADQCNFGGLGATGGGAQGATFANVREGLRAQVQHLKAYASTDALVNDCVDPRFSLVSRGCAPNLEDLNGRWAVPGDGYGQDILRMINLLLGESSSGDNGADQASYSIENKYSAPNAAFEKTIEDGEYLIQCQSVNGSVLQINDDGSAYSSALSLATSNMKDSQKFKFERDSSTGYYRIKSSDSGKYLGLISSGGKYSACIAQRSYSSDDVSLQWKVESNSDGSVVIKAAVNEGYCFGSASDGSKVQLHSANGTAAQRFSLISTSPKVEGGRTVDDGVYAVSLSSDQSIALGISGSSVGDGDNAQATAAAGLASQKFRFTLKDDGFYEVLNLNSGKVLDADGGNLVPGTNVLQWSDCSADNQRWAVQRCEGGYRLVCKANGLALALGAGAHAGSNAFVSVPADGQGQVFSIEPAVLERVVSDGEYVVSSQVEATQVFDIAGASTENGARLEVYRSNMAQNQRFRFERDGDTGFYKVTCVGSGKVLDDDNRSVSNGAAVIQYDSTDALNQRWIVRREGSGLSIRSAIDPSYCIDLTGGGASDCTKAEVYRYGGGENQRFSLISTSPKVEGGRTVDDGVYAVSLSSDQSIALGISGSSVGDGDNAQATAAAGLASQKFRFTLKDDGFYEVLNLNSGKVLDADGGNLVPGTNVLQWSDCSADNQRWAVQRCEGGYRLVCKANGLALALGAGAHAGSNAFVSVPADGQGQVFSIEPAVLERVVSDGEYVVSSQVEATQVFDIAGASTENGARLEVYRSNMAQNQRFRFERDGDTGFYKVTCVGSGKVLDDDNRSVSNGAAVIQYDSTDALNQRWIVRREGSGLSIRSAIDPSYCIDLTGGGASDCTKAEVCRYGGGENQRFSLISTKIAPVSESEDYGFEGWYGISPASDDSLRIDIAKASSVDGAKALLYGSNSGFNQLFNLEYENGYYRLISACSGKALELEAGSVVPGIAAQQASISDSPNQKWKVERNEDGTYSFICIANGLKLGFSSLDAGASLVGKSLDSTDGISFRLAKRTSFLNEGIFSISYGKDRGKVLDVNNASKSDGANVLIYSSASNLNQKWKVSAVPGRENVYTFESLCSGKYMTVANGNVVQATYEEGSEKQMWTPVNIDAGAVVLQNVSADKVLDVNGGSTSNGANVQVYSRNGSAAQRFFLDSVEPVKNATFVLHSGANYNQVIDLNNSSPNDGAKVTTWGSNNGDNQKWNVTGNGDGTYRIGNPKTGKVLDISGGAASDGACIVQYSWHGGLNQKWIVVYDKDGGFVFESAQDRSIVLAVGSSAPSDGASIRAEKKSGKASQRFCLEETVYVPPMPSDRQAMQNRIWGYGSGTQWLIGVDRSSHQVGVFRGSAYDWSLQHWWSCVTGAPSTPTITGYYRTTGGKRMSLSTDSRAKWCTQIWNGYFFHTILDSDAELGNSLSHGCLRMSYPSAQWIYNNIYAGTAVVIYN